MEGMGWFKPLAPAYAREQTVARLLTLQSISPEHALRLAEAARATTTAVENHQEFEAALERFRGELVAWGGEIVESLPDGADAIETMFGAVVSSIRNSRVFRKEGASSEQRRERPLVEQLRERIRAGEIPLYPVDQRDLRWRERADPIDFLKRWYGEYLTYFGGASDAIFQRDLEKLDPGLLRKLRNRFQYLRRKKGDTSSLSDIIPSLIQGGDSAS